MKETLTPGGVTRFNLFSHGGAIYYTATRGAFWIFGDIYKKWMATGGELGELGYPTSDEEFASDEVCRCNRFSGGGAIYSTPEVSKLIFLILRVLTPTLQDIIPCFDISRLSANTG